LATTSVTGWSLLRTTAPAAGVNGRGVVTDAVADASLTVVELEGCDGDEPELHAAVAIAIAPQKTEDRFIIDINS